MAHPSRTSIGVSPSVRTEHPTRVPRTPCQPCIYHRSPHILVGSYGTPPPVGLGLGRPASTVPVGTGREWMMVALVPLCWPLQNPGMLLHCGPRTWATNSPGRSIVHFQPPCLTDYAVEHPREDVRLISRTARANTD